MKDGVSLTRKSSIGTIQDWYVLFSTDHGSSTLQKSSYTSTYLPSHKPSKYDEQNMLGCAGELRTNLKTSYLSWTPTHGRASIGQQVRIYIHQLLLDTGYTQEGLPRAIDNRDRKRNEDWRNWLDDDDGFIFLNNSKVNLLYSVL